MATGFAIPVADHLGQGAAGAEPRGLSLQHEPCWYAVREKATGHWSGDRKQTTLWQIASRDQDAATVHGTQKPVECMRRPMLNNASPGQAVYEPFCGSGTTLIAAETCGRHCHAVELDPAYVDVAVQRWQAFTGARGGAGGDGHDLCRSARHTGGRGSGMTGRPPASLSEAQRVEVETLAAVLNAEQIADFLGIGRTTFFALLNRDPDLCERYRKGKARAVGAVAQSLVTKARAGNVTAMIFFLKTQGGWRETVEVAPPRQEGNHRPERTQRRDRCTR